MGNIRVLLLYVSYPLCCKMTMLSCLHIVNQSKDGMQDEEKYKDHFLGVMGTDVPLDYLQEFMLQPLVSKMNLEISVTNGFTMSIRPA